jgi:hypothetical protein
LRDKAPTLVSGLHALLSVPPKIELTEGIRGTAGHPTSLELVAHVVRSFRWSTASSAVTLGVEVLQRSFFGSRHLDPHRPFAGVPFLAAAGALVSEDYSLRTQCADPAGGVATDHSIRVVWVDVRVEQAQ